MKHCIILIILFFAPFLGIRTNAQSTINGYLINNSGDTIETVFSVAKKKRIDKRNNFNFIEVLSGDSIVRLTSKSLLGYRKGDIFYKCFKVADRDTTFFGQLITSGKVDLYHTIVYGGKYYFKKRGEREFYELDSELEIIVSTTEDSHAPHLVKLENSYLSAINPTIPNITSNESELRDFFIQYFKDHQLIMNKLKHGFYTFSSIESMFKEYNQQE